jgi:acyl-[acyl-carrier-protein] desaturase
LHEGDTLLEAQNLTIDPLFTTQNLEEDTTIELFPDEDLTEGSPQSVRLLSREERSRQVERAIYGLYRWYVARSQTTRNWNPESNFAWGDMRHDHSPDVVMLIEGFFAVEQYVPDYTSKIVNLVRRSFGRSHFQLRWGAEEERHAETWENALLYSRRRSPAYIEQYKHDLRINEWNLPWEDPLHMVMYTVFQERATQLNYLNFARIAKGESTDPAYKNDVDPVLARACSVLAIDEAAHYAFFLECARLLVYYFPEDSLEAIHDVVNHFAMPAQEAIPNWAEVAEVIYRTGVYGPRDYQRNVLAPVFANLTVEGRKALDKGIKESKAIPDHEGKMRLTALFKTFDPGLIEDNVIRLHDKVIEYEVSTGRDVVDPIRFLRNPDWPVGKTA